MTTAELELTKEYTNKGVKYAPVLAKFKTNLVNIIMECYSRWLTDYDIHPVDSAQLEIQYQTSLTDPRR